MKNLLKLNFDKKVYIRLVLLVVLICFLFVTSYAWFHDEDLLTGTSLAMGRLEHSITQYDETGEVINIVDSDSVPVEQGVTESLIYETALSNSYINSKYIAISNIGTLDMEYDVTFQLDGTLSDAGMMYYRIYEITDDVTLYEGNNAYTSPLKGYIANSAALTNAIESDTVHPIKNMSLIKYDKINGEIYLEDDVTRYYRIDYGVYLSFDTDQYDDTSIAIHTNVYTTQVGVDDSGDSSAQTWYVDSEVALRNAATYGAPGDTIQLTSDITIDGSLVIPSRINLDTNEFAFTVSGDLGWQFNDIETLNIDVTGRGAINVGGDFFVLAPMTEVEIVGANTSYDIYVGGDFTIDGIQNGEIDGVYLNNVAIVKNRTTLVPADINVESNTRLTVGNDVVVGFIYAVAESTNIEIINNGYITSIDLSNMILVDSFTKYQIYIYNLNTIYGTMNSTCIVLPTNATPYIEPNNGNTLIIKGLASNDITVSGSDSFTQQNIEYSTLIDSVIPIEDESVVGYQGHAYYVYIREATESLGGLLEEYFEENGYVGDTAIDGVIGDIKKLVVYTVNAQSFENEDFDYIRGSCTSLEYLSIANSRVLDGTTPNRIKDNALYNKQSLKYLYLPTTVTAIGEYAFYGCPIGRIQNDGSFDFVTIPASVTSIGVGAFSAAASSFSPRYIKFLGFIPPALDADASNNTAFSYNYGTRLFVPEAALETYMTAENYNEEYIHRTAYLADRTDYFVYDTPTGIGISLYVNYITTGGTLLIHPSLSTGGGAVSYYVTEIGPNAYRHISLSNNGVRVNLPSRVTSIKYGAFKSQPITDISIANVTEIGAYAFYETRLGAISGAYVTTIGDRAFQNCANIEAISFPALQELGAYAFASCTNLYEVNLGVVNTIGLNALYNNRKLTRVYFLNTNSILNINQYVININYTGSDNPNDLISNWGYYIENRLRIYVPIGSDLNGNTYLSLYKNLFSDYASYIYNTGTITGNEYTYSPDLNYDMKEYNIRMYNANGVEIVDYHGPDIGDDYVFPQSFTIGDMNYPVVSVGEGAYRHTATVLNRDEYDNVIETLIPINGPALIHIGAYAFYNLGITSISADNVTIIGAYAFSGTSLRTASFGSLMNIGPYALSSISTLTTVDLGTVLTIGSGAVSNNPNLIQLFIDTTDITNLSISSDAFTDLGSATTDIATDPENQYSRVRIYVPDGVNSINGNTYLSFYANALPDVADYIYVRGDYILDYSDDINSLYNRIGRYSVRTVNVYNANGVEQTGLEIIEYHGEDITSGYTFPNSFLIEGVSIPVISIGERAYYHSRGTAEFDITSTALLQINKKAFAEFPCIGNIVAANVVSIGDNAFDGSSLHTGRFSNLHQIGTRTFANSDVLYMLDLGKVYVMPQNAVYNLSRLVQVFFDVVDENVSFASGAITAIGGNDFVSGHLRIYVYKTKADGSLINGDTFVNLYKQKFSTYANYIFARGTIVNDTDYMVTGIPYIIGDYSVLNDASYSNSNNQVVFGYEFVEYHGGLIPSTFTIPESITAEVVNRTTGVVSNVTANVISVGDYAFTHASMVANATFDINNSRLVNIGAYAFRNIGIRNMTASSVAYIGDYAFENSSLRTGVFNNLVTLRTMAFANIQSLRMLNLGKVTEMGVNSLYNLPGLLQIFMIGRPTVNFGGGGAINSIGSDTGAEGRFRLRIYVDGVNPNTAAMYYQDYKTYFNSYYQDYFFPLGEIIGSFTPTNSDNFDIGVYSVRFVERSNSAGNDINGLEFVEYHGDYIESSFTIENTVSLANGSSANVISIGDYAFRFATMLANNSFAINNNNILYVGNYAFSGLAGVNNVTIDNCIYVGNRAFYNNIIHVFKDAELRTLGDYALASNVNMNVADLGKVSSIGAYALNGNVNLEQLFFGFQTNSGTSGTAGVGIGTSALPSFSSLNIGERFRVYVPSSGPSSAVTFVSLYQTTLNPYGYSPYVYQKGSFVGTFQVNTTNLSYDIGEYTVVYRTDRSNLNGGAVSGYELVEYHGPDIAAALNLPGQLSVGGGTSYNLISIGERAFIHTSGTSNTSWTMELPANLVYIGEEAFSETNICSLTANNVREVAYRAFYNCDYLQEVEFVALYQVGDYAFYDCNILYEIRLGTSGNNYGAYAFYRAYTANETSKRFYIAATTPPTAQGTTFPEVRSQSSGGFFGGTSYYYNVYIYVLIAYEDVYEGQPPYSNYCQTGTGWISSGTGDRVIGAASLGRGLTYRITSTNPREVEVSGYLGRTDGSTNTLTIPDTVNLSGQNYTITSIAANALDVLESNIRTVEFGPNIRSVGNYFMAGNSYIQTIRLTQTSTYFSAIDGVLYDATGTILIKFPNGKAVTTTSGSWWNPTTNYYSYDVPDNTAVIAVGAFAGCTNLGSISFPASLLVISALAFEGCDHLKTIAFDSTTPPYLTGFDVFQIISGFAIDVDNSNTVRTAYRNAMFFRKYSTYIN